LEVDLAWVMIRPLHGSCSVGCVLDRAQEPANQAWPDWTKKAAARLLQMWFSTTRTQEWEDCFDSNDPIGAFAALFEDGRLMGHFVKLSKCWSDHLDKNQTGLGAEHQAVAGESIAETLKHIGKHSSKLVQTGATESTQTFFRNFSRAMEKELGLRDQDQRAFRTYLLLLGMWPHVESFRGHPLMDLYDWLLPVLPLVVDEEGKDEEDLKERHFKWFEGLCEKQLGLRLRKRGGQPGIRR